MFVCLYVFVFYVRVCMCQTERVCVLVSVRRSCVVCFVCGSMLCIYVCVCT